MLKLTYPLYLGVHLQKTILCLASVLITTLLSGCSSTTPSPRAQINLNQSLNWLTINQHRDGVQQTPSGLQYKILKKANGCKPGSSSTVTVNYDMRIATTNQMVDKNHPGSTPTELPLSKVIKGWKEGVKLMQVGEVWEFYIPPELGYGDKNSGADIQANMALASKIWLIAAKPCHK